MQELCGPAQMRVSFYGLFVYIGGAFDTVSGEPFSFEFVEQRIFIIGVLVLIEGTEGNRSWGSSGDGRGTCVDSLAPAWRHTCSSDQGLVILRGG